MNVQEDIPEDIAAEPQQTAVQQSEAGPAGSPPAQTPQAKPSSESESLQALKLFYRFLALQQFDKAYDILYEGFKVNLDIFRQFGVNEVTKADIDLSQVFGLRKYFQDGED